MVTQPAVQVSRGALIALVAALAVSVLAIAFFVGRESGRVQPAPAQPVVTVATPPVASVSPPIGAVEPSTLAPYPLSAPPIAPPPVPSVPTASPAQSGRDSLRDAVATYFRSVDLIQSQAKSWNDPEALARTLLDQGSRGDMSGFDGLAAANRKVRDDLRALDVPEPCREHHRATLALVEESVSMLDRVKAQFQGSDTSSLTAIAGSSQELERKAKEVDAQAEEIKRRFGL